MSSWLFQLFGLHHLMFRFTVGSIVMAIFGILQGGMQVAPILLAQHTGVLNSTGRSILHLCGGLEHGQGGGSPDIQGIGRPQHFLSLIYFIFVFLLFGEPIERCVMLYNAR